MNSLLVVGAYTNQECFRFRELVFGDFGSRFAFVIQLMQEVAFHKLDLRLGQFLLGNDLSKITHQKIALELGTVREIISRLLKQFQQEGLGSVPQWLSGEALAAGDLTKTSGERLAACNIRRIRQLKDRA